MTSSIYVFFIGPCCANRELQSDRSHWLSDKS